MYEVNDEHDNAQILWVWVIKQKQKPKYRNGKRETETKTKANQQQTKCKTKRTPPLLGRKVGGRRAGRDMLKLAIK